MTVHLVDGTYELFRHFYGGRRYRDQKGERYGAVLGVLRTILAMIRDGATHIGVATDHVVESFRNDLWQGYKTAQGMDPDLLAQFQPLEDALAAMGIVVWAMAEQEADDALASAAVLAARDQRVQKVCIWTPDKDLTQCVVDSRVVQVDRRTGVIRDRAGVIQKFGVPPELIPDYLALVGDSADGFPGLKGIGPVTASRLIAQHGQLEAFPESILAGRLDQALLFKRLATLVTDLPLFSTVDGLKWTGPTDSFGKWSSRLGGPTPEELPPVAEGPTP
jgi:5'-3' exonuclease